MALPAHRAAPLACLLALGLGPAACGTVPAAQRSAPEYGAEDTGLFGDRMAAAALGGEAAALEGRSGDDETRLRASRADGVVRVVVKTFSADRLGAAETPRYTLVVQPVGPPLRGRGIGSQFELVVPPGSPAYSQVRAAEATLVGKRLILFYRRYTVDGQEVVRWHAEADTAEVAALVATPP